MNNQGNAAVGRIQRCARLPQTLIGKHAHVRDLICPQALQRHQALALSDIHNFFREMLAHLHTR